MQPTIRSYHNLPVHKPFNDGHLSLLELFFGVSTSSMGKINCMADLNVICQRDILHFDAEMWTVNLFGQRARARTNSCVSHFPNSLTSCPSFETSFGSVCTVAILKLERAKDNLLGESEIVDVASVLGSIRQILESRFVATRQYPAICTATHLPITCSRRTLSLYDNTILILNFTRCKNGNYGLIVLTFSSSAFFYSIWALECVWCQCCHMWHQLWRFRITG